MSNKFIEKKVLKEIWEEITMLQIFKYVEEIALEKGLEQGLEQGLKKGKEQGLKEGKEQGLKEGILQGKEQGLKEGKEQGLKEGKEQGLKEGKEQGLKEGIEIGKRQGLIEGIGMLIKARYGDKALIKLYTEIEGIETEKLELLKEVIIGIEELGELEEIIKELRKTK
jgi:flagellar biosynthesis/type III secretory pathway protein FliH